MNFRRSLLLGTSALAVNAALTGAVALMPEPALAACQTVNSDTTISSSISCITWNSSNISITGAGTVAGSSGVFNSGNAVGNLTNSGVNGGSAGIFNSAGSIGRIRNNGTISSSTAIYNTGFGSIGTISNTGTISVSRTGIHNYQGSTIDAISNSGLLTSSGSIGIRNDNGSTIGTISNNAGGTITGGQGGIENQSGIGTITNDTGGTISGDFSGINNASGGSIGTISNSGVISSNFFGIENFYGTVGTITNSGTIRSSVNAGNSSAAISSNSGTIGTISNSGLITGPAAVFSGNSGMNLGTILSPISNTGAIAGNINVTQDLTFTGGNASTIGTLTGYGTVTGTITANNLTFDTAAYQLLDDEVNVGSGSGTVTNSGTLMVNATHTITGNYVQGSSALLVVGVIDPTHYGNLVITGNATMTNDHVSITPVSGTLASDESFTIVQDTITGIADYSGITATASGFTTSISSIVSGGFDDLVISLSGGGGGGGGGGTYGPIGSAAGGGVVPAVGAALDQILAGGDPAFNPIFTALNNLGSISQASEQAGIKQLAPNQIMPQLTASGLLMDQAVHVVGQHQESLLARNGDGPPAEASAQAGSTTGRAAGSEYESGIFWAQASGGVATKDSSADSGGYKQSFYGLTFGIDDHIGKDTTLGEAIAGCTATPAVAAISWAVRCSSTASRSPATAPAASALPLSTA